MGGGGGGGWADVEKVKEEVLLNSICYKSVNKVSSQYLNSSCTKVFGTHILYQGGGGGGGVFIYLWISKKESKSCENNSSPEISVDCIQLIVGTFSNVSLDSFFKIEQDYLWSFKKKCNSSKLLHVFS